MGKSQKQLRIAAAAFMTEMAEAFPWLEMTASFEEFEGYEAWISIGLPQSHEGEYWNVQNAASELEERLAGDGPVRLVSTVGVIRTEVAKNAG